MSENCQAKWVATEEQIQSIIMPGMKNIAQQCAGYGKELECPQEFNDVMLRDIADAFDEPPTAGKLRCECCWLADQLENVYEKFF